MAFWAWSKTAASNANADSTINYAEGQAPSSLNDSARAAMARVAEWRDDISGTITTSGTSTAYTVTSNQVFDSLAHMNGAMIAFVPHTTCGATVTLNVDSLGAKPLRSAPSVELPSGILVQGTPYIVTYNNSDAAFYLRDFYALPYTVPIGGLLPYVGTTAPNSNFVLPFGQAISRSTYATLFGLCASQFGGGDGSTTFNIPDLRGRAVFGVTNMGGSDNGLITVAGGNFDGTIRTTGGAQNRTLTTAQLPVVTPTGTVTGSGNLAINCSVVTVGTTGNPTSVVSSSELGNATFTGNSFGSGASHPTMPPAMTLSYILRVI